MAQVVQKFRSSLGGFNRRDVLNYIEASDSRYRRETAELQSRLDAAEASGRELEARLAGLETEKGTSAAEEAKIRASLEQSTAALGKVRGELNQAETQLEGSKRQLAQLQAQVEEMEPLAKSYQELKDRIATVELDAHKRAHAILDEANAQAEALRQETSQWLSGIMAQYGQLRESLDSLDVQIQAVSRISEQIKAGDQAAVQLREQGGLE